MDVNQQRDGNQQENGQEVTERVEILLWMKMMHLFKGIREGRRDGLKTLRKTRFNRKRDGMKVMTRIYKLNQYLRQNPMNEDEKIAVSLTNKTQSSQLKDKTRSERAMVVKKLFVNDMIDNNHLFTITNQKCSSAFRASNLEILPSIPASNDSVLSCKNEGSCVESLLEMKEKLAYDLTRFGQFPSNYCQPENTVNHANDWFGGISSEEKSLGGQSLDSELHSEDSMHHDSDTLACVACGKVAKEMNHIEPRVVSIEHRKNHVAQTVIDHLPTAKDIDPEFLIAHPPDDRKELTQELITTKSFLDIAQLEFAKIAEVKAVASRVLTMVELEGTKVNLKKPTGDVTCSAITIESLRKELERESEVLEKTWQPLRKTCAAVASLEAKLNQITEAVIRKWKSDYNNSLHSALHMKVHSLRFLDAHQCTGITPKLREMQGSLGEMKIKENMQKSKEIQ
eukprot:Gb_40723 [translate_table: standard]